MGLCMCFLSRMSTGARLSRCCGAPPHYHSVFFVGLLCRSLLQVSFMGLCVCFVFFLRFLFPAVFPVCFLFWWRMCRAVTGARRAQWRRSPPYDQKLQDCRPGRWCVAACCSVLQRVAACCSSMQHVAVGCSMLQCATFCCNVLQCLATLCCSVLQVLCLTTWSQNHYCWPRKWCIRVLGFPPPYCTYAKYTHKHTHTHTYTHTHTCKRTLA